MNWKGFSFVLKQSNNSWWGLHCLYYDQRTCMTIVQIGPSSCCTTTDSTHRGTIRTARLCTIFFSFAILNLRVKNMNSTRRTARLLPKMESNLTGHVASKHLHHRSSRYCHSLQMQVTGLELGGDSAAYWVSISFRAIHPLVSSSIFLQCAIILPLLLLQVFCL